MSKALDKAKQDIKPEWVELSNRVREYLAVCLDRPADEDSLKALAREVLALCDHVDRVYGDLTELIGALEASESDSARNEPSESAIDLAAIEEHQDTHDTRSDPMDILKALLMWRDDPAERLPRNGG